MLLHPLGLLALLAVPAVVALHLYRRRYRPQRVSALFLWSADDRSASAGRTRQPLRRSPSFWCELLASLCLGLALAGPRACGAVTARHLVAVLDGSASLEALEPLSGTTVAERVRRDLAAEIEDLPAGSRVTLVASGPEARVLVGPRAMPEEALQRLTEWRPGHARHDLFPAVTLAQQLAAGGAVDLWTDRLEPDRWPAEVGLRARGRALGNVGLTRASRRRGRARDDDRPVQVVELVLRSFDTRPRDVTLELLGCPPGEAEGALPGDPVLPALERREVHLAPGEDAALRLELPDDAPPVVVQLTTDALPLDDVAFLAPDPERRVRVCVDLDEATAERLGSERWAELVPGLEPVASPEQAHLVVARHLPAGEAWALVLDADPQATDWNHLVGPFLVDRAHPLLDGVTLDGVVWSASAGPQPVLPDGAPLVAAGDRPLLVERHEGGRRTFRADLEPLRSNLSRTPDWPVLLVNLCELVRDALPGLERASLAVGDPLRYVSATPARYVLEGAGEEQAFAARDVLEAHGATRPGWYRLWRTPADGTTRVVALAGLSFQDPAQSDLSGAGSGDRAADLAQGEVQVERSWEELTLVFLGLLLFGLDGWVLRRRTTGRSPWA